MTGRRAMALGSVCLALAAVVRAQERPVVNWAAPLYWAPGEATASAAFATAEAGAAPHGKVAASATATVPTSPVPLIGITPCRIADTRDGTRPPGYGPPSLTPAQPRDFTLTGVCGIAAAAQAVSLNVTVVNPQGLGYVLLYPQGGGQPVVSTLNFTAGATVANAAIVPLGAGGGITVVAAVSGTDVLLDVNGYYAGAGVGVYNTFLGFDAGNFTMTGEANTAVGATAFRSNTSGEGNTALGVEALRDGTSGERNTAVGISALTRNTQGGFNTAVGQGALYWVEGSLNVGIGAFAGTLLMSGGNNIYVGSEGGDPTESNTIRLGGAGQFRAFVTGVRDVTTGASDAIPVVIDSAGQLGTISSSARFKEEIADMADASSGLLELRPVTFRYRGQAGERRQFGLVAEEVEDVLPELVVRGPSGEAQTVLYHEMPAMLVNELQKQQKRIECQDNEIAALRARLSALESERRIPEEAP